MGWRAGRQLGNLGVLDIDCGSSSIMESPNRDTEERKVREMPYGCQGKDFSDAMLICSVSGQACWGGAAEGVFW